MNGSENLGQLIASNLSEASDGHSWEFVLSLSQRRASEVWHLLQKASVGRRGQVADAKVRLNGNWTDFFNFEMSFCDIKETFACV